MYIKFFSLYLCHRGSIFAALTLLVVLIVISSCWICFCSARYVYWLEWWLKSVVFIILMQDDRKFWLYLAVLFILMDATFSSIPSFSKVISSGKADHIYPSMCFLGKGIYYYYFFSFFFFLWLPCRICWIHFILNSLPSFSVAYQISSCCVYSSWQLHSSLEKQTGKNR